jgi:hypothetical protein
MGIRLSRGAPTAFLVALTLLASGTYVHGADDSYAANAGRLEKMTPEQKDDLRRKKLRFDALSPAEQQKLRELHSAITGDANSKELLDTVKSYNRWLATLDAVERSSLLDIKDPAERIARIKTLIQQQEERRFREYAGNLPEDDRNVIYKWLGEWVNAHAEAIRGQLPRDMKQRIDDAPDDEARRRALVGAWLQWGQRSASPAANDYGDLLKQLSAETQKTIESSVANELNKEPEAQRTSERQQVLTQQRIGELVRAARISRIFPQISLDELLKYYAAMKSDDPRRKQLEGKEGEELRSALQRYYNWDHGFGRGGPPGGRGFGPGSSAWIPPPPGPPRGDGRGARGGGKPGERSDERERGGKESAGDKSDGKAAP